MNPPTSYINPTDWSYLLYEREQTPVFNIIMIHERKKSTNIQPQPSSQYVHCTMYFLVPRIDTMTTLHSVSHFKFSIIALGSEKDWKCQQFLTVVLQTKNEVSIGNPHHSTSYLGIDGVGSYYEYFECRGGSSRWLQYCNSKLFICDSQEYFHSVNEY